MNSYDIDSLINSNDIDALINSYDTDAPINSYDIEAVMVSSFTHQAPGSMQLKIRQSS